MKITNIYAQNFGSYKEISFSFTDFGVVLITGATGSGKSTICDLLPWILFSKTAKNGTVDEVRAWGQKDTTKGLIELEGGLRIVRTRFPNDLYIERYGSDSGVITRGKDLADTQRLINELIGMDADTYLSGAYLHEFSQTSQFFTTNAKNRRALIEQVVDLSLPIKLQDKLSVEKKQWNIKVNELESQQQKLEGRFESYVEQIDSAKESDKNFKSDRDAELAVLGPQISRLELKLKPFDYYLHDISALKQSIKDLTAESRCKECGAPKQHELLNDVKDELKKLELAQAENNLVKSKLEALENTADRILQRKNNFAEVIATATQNAAKAEIAIRTTQQDIDAAKLQLADISTLSDIVEQYRSLSIQNTIDRVQNNTNELLSKYFDAELSVSFTATSADKLEIDLYKDGNEASYTQLSKGQRCLLKLCFGVSMMKAIANRHGVDFEQVFFDEALEGLDENMKLRAVNLLRDLPHKSVYVVEHSPALKAMIDTQYQVTITNGRSAIEKA